MTRRYFGRTNALTVSPRHARPLPPPVQALSFWTMAPSQNFTAICKAQAPRMSASPQACHVAGLPEHVGQYARPAKTDVVPIRGWAP